jgi:hypothetical protein
VFVEIGITDYKHLLVRVVDSPSPLEYSSDQDDDAEGSIVTDGSFMTPASSSPVRPQEAIVGDAMETGESTEGRLAEVGTLVPIEEVEEVVPDSESDEAPQENEEPIPVPEQPPAYTPVRGQRATRGGRAFGSNFRRHRFPYLVDPDSRPAPAYSHWTTPLAKRQRSGDEGEDFRRAKRARVVESYDGDESDGRGVESPSRSGRGHEYAPSPGV